MKKIVILVSLASMIVLGVDGLAQTPSISITVGALVDPPGEFGFENGSVQRLDIAWPIVVPLNVSPDEEFNLILQPGFSLDRSAIDQLVLDTYTEQVVELQLFSTLSILDLTGEFRDVNLEYELNGDLQRTTRLFRGGIRLLLPDWIGLEARGEYETRDRPQVAGKRLNHTMLTGLASVSPLLIGNVGQINTGPLDDLEFFGKTRWDRNIYPETTAEIQETRPNWNSESLLLLGGANLRVEGAKLTGSYAIENVIHPQSPSLDFSVTEIMGQFSQEFYGNFEFPKIEINALGIVRRDQKDNTLKNEDVLEYEGRIKLSSIQNYFLTGQAAYYSKEYPHDPSLASYELWKREGKFEIFRQQTAFIAEVRNHLKEYSGDPWERNNSDLLDVKLTAEFDASDEVVLTGEGRRKFTRFTERNAPEKNDQTEYSASAGIFYTPGASNFTFGTDLSYQERDYVNAPGKMRSILGGSLTAGFAIESELGELKLQLRSGFELIDYRFNPPALQPDSGAEPERRLRLEFDIQL